MQDSFSALDLSCIIITLNEEQRLAQCLESLPQGAEIIVLDSGSTDATCAVARQFGARVEVKPFTNHADQKNAALALARRRWVFSIDADEVLDRALCEDLIAISRMANPPFFGYRTTRRLWFMGRRMRFGKTLDRPVRLALREQARFVGSIHERMLLQGTPPLGTLKGELAHYSYEDISDYFSRFNRYTSKIAEAHADSKADYPKGAKFWLRPWAEFFIRYVLRLGFLDGYPGYCYALFSCLYSFVKYAKLREIFQKKSQKSY